MREVPTGGIFFGHDLEQYDLHRCYRCFHNFSPADEVPSEDDAGVEIADLRLELEEAGAKFSVEEFVITVENESEKSVRVDQVLLAFDDADEKVVPVTPSVLGPGETDSFDVPLSWIHPDQDVMTIELRSRGETILSTETNVGRPE